MIVIGEKLNATIPKVREALIARDSSAVKSIAEAQAPLCNYIDVNVGTGQGAIAEEPALMEWLIAQVRQVTDKPLVIDTTNPQAVKKALELEASKNPIVNSISAETARIEQVLPLVADAKVDVVILTMGDSGIPSSVEGRMQAADFAMEKAIARGLKEENIFFDPLILPVATDAKNGRISLETISALKQKYPLSKVVVGLSNVSFGLPKRSIINRNFMVLALGAGADGAICDPLDGKLMTAVKAAEVILGKDEWCRAYTQSSRKGKLVD